MYRPRTVALDTLKGRATIKKGRIKGDVVFGVTFEDKPSVTYTIREEDAPNYVEPGEFYVKLKDKNTIESTSPLFGTFRVKVERFSAKKGEQPAPFVVENKKYNSSSEKFTVELRITSKQYKGMPIVLFLPYYWFAEDEITIKGEVKSVVGFKPNKKESVARILLINFLTGSGAWDSGPVQWSDNILPDLQKRILRADKEFAVNVENGFVNQISPIIQDWGDKDDEIDEKEETPEFEEDEIPFGGPEEASEFEEDSDDDDDEKPAWDEVTD